MATLLRTGNFIHAINKTFWSTIFAFDLCILVIIVLLWFNNDSVLVWLIDTISRGLK